jgi:transcriptional regulator with XRE-family HTH domain
VTEVETEMALEIWMHLANRKRLLTLMAIHDLSQRKLARIAGYKSHAYMGRLCRGTASNLEPEAALRIAHYFRVPVEDLFLTRTSNDARQNVQSRSVA